MLSVVLLTLLSLPTSGRTLLILPVEGEGVLPAVREQLDTQVRTAALSLDATAMTRPDTDAALEDAVSGGLQCSVQIVDCAVQLGIVAGVTDLIITTARAHPTLELTLTRVDVERRQASMITAGRVDLSNKTSAEPLLKRLWSPPATVTLELSGLAGVVAFDGIIHGPAAHLPTVAIEPGAHVIAVIENNQIMAQQNFTASTGFQRVVLNARAAPEVVAPTPSEASTPTSVIAGGVTAGIAGVVTAGGLVALGAAELALGTPNTSDKITEFQTVGRVGAAVAAAGLIGVGVGVAIALLGGEP